MTAELATTTADTNSGSQPLTVTPSGTAPKTRFTTAAGVWQSYEQAFQESAKSDFRFADMRAMYDGMPMELGDVSQKQINAGDLPNVNLRKFKSKLKTYVGNFTQLDCGADTIANVTVKMKYCQSPTQKTLWDQQLTQFFSEAFPEWDADCNSMAQYVLESAVRNTQMAIYGIGLAYFRDEIDWRFVAVPTRSVRVPRGTKISLRNHAATFVDYTMTATELWEKRNVNGWDKDVVAGFLYDRLGEGNLPNGGRATFAEWQNTLANNELYYQRDFREIHLVHAYVQEFNDLREKDGVSHYVIGQFNQDPRFLYESVREFDSIAHVLIPFTDDPSPEGDWHGVKGYGDDIFDLCHFENLYFNHMATMALLSSTPMFASATEDDRRRLSQIVWSRLGMMAPGLILQQTSLKVDLAGCESIFAAADRILNEVSRTYPQGDVVNQRTKTATQETFDRQDESQMTGLQLLAYRTLGLDRLFTEMYRRLSASNYPSGMPGGKAAKNFRDKCDAMKIPKECYQDPQSVRASRKGGSGNAQLDIQRAQLVLKYATPGEGQANAKKLIIAGAEGWDQVPAYYQDVPKADSDDEAMTLENAHFAAGKLTTAQSYQDHAKHLGTPDPAGPGHLSILAASRAAAMQIQQQGVKNHLEDAQRLSQTIDAAVHHSAEHMQFLQQMLAVNDDPDLKQMVKQLNEVVTVFTKFAGEFDRTVAQAAQQQAQQAPQMAVDDQIKMEKWQIEKQQMIERHQLEMQLHAQSQDLKMGQIAERAKAKEHFSEQEHLQKLGQQGEATLLQNHIQKTQASVDAAAQITQNLQSVHQNAVDHLQTVTQSDQQHQQALDQAQQEHDQNIAQTRAEHNVKLEQNGPATP